MVIIMLHQHDIDILNCIYKNSRMASDCIKQVEEKCDEGEFRNYIHRQQEHYEATCKELKNEIENSGAEVEQIPKMETAMAHMGISMKAFADDSQNNFAKMMYNGTNMGIIEGRRLLNHKSTNDEIHSLVQEYVDMQEQAVEKLKQFL